MVEVTPLFVAPSEAPPLDHPAQSAAPAAAHSPADVIGAALLVGILAELGALKETAMSQVHFNGAVNAWIAAQQVINAALASRLDQIEAAVCDLAARGSVH